MTLNPFLRRLACAVALTLCAGASVATSARAENATLPPGLDPLVQNMDRSVSPGADFFKYANGGWIAKQAFAAGSAHRGRAFVGAIAGLGLGLTAAMIVLWSALGLLSR